jgi:uncharacterized protein YciI
MKYFAAVQSLLNADKCTEYRDAHLEFLQSMLKEGRIFARGRFPDGSGGLTIFEAESLEEARKMAESDPYVREGGRKLDVHEWAMKLTDK